MRAEQGLNETRSHSDEMIMNAITIYIYMTHFPTIYSGKNSHLSIFEKF